MNNGNDGPSTPRSDRNALRNLQGGLSPAVSPVLEGGQSHLIAPDAPRRNGHGNTYQVTIDEVCRRLF